MKQHWSGNASLWLGIISIFLWEFSILPILAIVFGGISLKERGSDWKYWARDWVGIVLGVLYVIVNIYNRSL